LRSKSHISGIVPPQLLRCSCLFTPKFVKFQIYSFGVIQRLWSCNLRHTSLQNAQNNPDVITLQLDL
jgi:hypothetical protein